MKIAHSARRGNQVAIAIFTRLMSDPLADRAESKLVQIYLLLYIP